MPSDPMQILAQVLPRAQSDDELASLAAELGPPPPADFRPATMPKAQPAAGARLQGMPQNPLVKGGGLPNLVPPMTQGEARTSPRVGELILGGGKRGF